jgi:hypothetical protein
MRTPARPVVDRPDRREGFGGDRTRARRRGVRVRAVAAESVRVAVSVEGGSVEGPSVEGAPIEGVLVAVAVVVAVRVHLVGVPAVGVVAVPVGPEPVTASPVVRGRETGVTGVRVTVGSALGRGVVGVVAVVGVVGRRAVGRLGRHTATSVVRAAWVTVGQRRIDGDRDPHVATELTRECLRDDSAQVGLELVLGEVVGRREQRGVVDDAKGAGQADEGPVLRRDLFTGETLERAFPHGYQVDRLVSHRRLRSLRRPPGGSSVGRARGPLPRFDRSSTPLSTGWGRAAGRHRTTAAAALLGWPGGVALPRGEGSAGGDATQPRAAASSGCPQDGQGIAERSAPPGSVKAPPRRRVARRRGVCAVGG